MRKPDMPDDATSASYAGPTSQDFVTSRPRIYYPAARLTLRGAAA
ncbi:MAG: hypothetical protein ACJ77W_01955 [Chloroflexota bacterium]